MAVQSGLERVAAAIDAEAEVIAVAGGEGARRLASLVSTVRLPGEGDEAVRAAIGYAAAGGRCVLLASGDTVARSVTALRELADAGLPVAIVVPSHGAEVGAALPDARAVDTLVLAALFADGVSPLPPVATASSLRATFAGTHARAWWFPYAVDGLAFAHGTLTPSRLDVHLVVPVEMRATWLRTVLDALADTDTAFSARMHEPDGIVVTVDAHDTDVRELLVVGPLPRDPAPRVSPRPGSVVVTAPGAVFDGVREGVHVCALDAGVRIDDRHLTAGAMRTFAREIAGYDAFLAMHGIDARVTAAVAAAVGGAVAAERVA